MPDPAWRVLRTLPDLPSAQSLAEVLGAAGMQVQVRSDAGVLGQAAPSRIYVAAAQFQQAQAFLAAGAASDEVENG
jgi:hypothetical protein